ncbi:polysaccharide biosynthesis protein [Crenothrix polyspora]|uniref:Polysaccharide biosynthesis protein CapD n=1 Tax=Crenothrix polyspora TaxID=360316 RepID=A0A1R4HB59_9GAMM|nr:nucleoside-diphosphate sugar epimerase/dehydratase [Crenothrix polyspora]SJM93475.1 Polysaccharide biosynthesis protein CapD [Crenothrix polyspora]
MGSQLAQWFIELSRKTKVFILISVDLFFTLFALWLAFYLRFGVLYTPKGNEWYLVAIAPIIAIPIFLKIGLYRAIIRYMEVRALWTIIQAATAYAVVFGFIFLQIDISSVPHTIFPLNWLIIVVLIAGSRFFARWCLGESYFRVAGEGIAIVDSTKKNVIIYGAGSAGVQLASALVYGNEFRPVAFIDDDALLHKQKVNGLRIYPLSSLSYLIKRHNVSNILLAIPSAQRARKSEIIRLLEPYGVHVMSMPGLSDIAQGRVTFDTLQEVDIADLLGRDAVAPNKSLLQANINGKVVMITGAGGSIGSELCRQIIQLQPATLILFELCEFALYEIEKELNYLLTKIKASTNPDIEIVSVLGSVVDAHRIEKVCRTFKIQTIYHTAAYKHVPMVEKNPGEAIWNNVFGTLHTAQAAIKADVETFVLISTDKAVRPTNTMGATKRFAELILQALSLDAGVKHHTRFTMVRFGNVLGSSGSVVPLFREQIARGGPVTVTDERVIRYFMTIPEASQLVIQAGAMGRGGDVFVLDMGEPIRILDLAKRMIHLSGLEIKDEHHLEGEIEISFTGLRPGEKLYEELLIGDNVSETSHKRIMRAEEHVIPWTLLQKMLAALEQGTKEDDFELIRSILMGAVSGFVPPCEIGDLLWQEENRITLPDIH